MGRRDGLTASESAANRDIPSPSEPLENITEKFTSKGLDIKDMVVLSGKHARFYGVIYAVFLSLFIKRVIIALT